MSIRPEGPIVAGKPVTIAVRIANTSGNAFCNAPSVWLATKLMLGGYMPEGDAVEITSIDDPNEPTKLAVGAVMVKKFLVVPPDARASSRWSRVRASRTACRARSSRARWVRGFSVADGTAPPEVAGK